MSIFILVACELDLDAEVALVVMTDEVAVIDDDRPIVADTLTEVPGKELEAVVVVDVRDEVLEELASN